MNSQALIVLILASLCIFTSAYYPSAYDMRFEPDYRGCNFKTSEEGLCAANWGVIIVEVLSNMYCIKQQKTNFLLSKQHLIDCTPYLPNATLEKCQLFGDSATLFKALEYVGTNGITTDQCYPYNSLFSGDENDCYTKCSDGSPIAEIYKGNYVNLTTINDVKDFLLNQGPIIALIEAYDDLLHYQTQSSGIDASGVSEYDSNLGYRTLKIVGWMTSNNVEYWIAGNSWGQNWAVSGFIYLETTSPHIFSYHALQLP